MQTIFGETRNYSVLFYEIVVYDNLNFRFGTGLNAQFCIVCLEDGLIVKPYSPIRGYGSRARRFLYKGNFKRSSGLSRRLNGYTVIRFVIAHSTYIKNFIFQKGCSSNLTDNKKQAKR